ncbi:MAG: hypothetical protein HY940_07415 [Gammaproteobacteria bacterium]|nr:hypothetical protein [Gammaproteobacteria bacterium]
MRVKRKQLLLIVMSSIISVSAHAFTMSLNFNNGPLALRADNFGNGYATFSSDASGTIYSNTQSYEGGQSVELNNSRGKEGFGKWGGVVKFPSPLKRGDEVWIRVRTYWPVGSTYDANPKLKFMRVKTQTATGVHIGYNDWYITPESSSSYQPFWYIYEGVQIPKYFGEQSDRIVKGVWETYEYNIKFDSQPEDKGGMAHTRMWKDGKLIGSITSSQTLVSQDDVATSFYLFTYWNHDPWKQVLQFLDAANYQVGEVVTGSNGISTTVASVNGNEITVDGHTIKVSPNYLAGQVIAGGGSGTSKTISGVLYTNPSVDVKMYVDDLVITSDKPSSKDSNGYYHIGSVAGPMIPSPPIILMQ